MIIKLPVYKEDGYYRFQIKKVGFKQLRWFFQGFFYTSGILFWILVLILLIIG